MVDKSNLENNESKNDPFGLMIACEGPTTASKVDFWKLIIQQNVTNVVSLFENNIAFFPTLEHPWLEWNSDDRKEKITLNLLEPLQSDDYLVKQRVEITYENQLSPDQPLIKINHTAEHTHFK